jgi:hypothetical protein
MHRHCCIPHVIDGHLCHGDYAGLDSERRGQQVLNQQNTHPNCLQPINESCCCSCYALDADCHMVIKTPQQSSKTSVNMSN